MNRFWIPGTPHKQISYRPLTLMAAGIWLLVVALSFGVLYFQSSEAYKALGQTQAQAALEKDLVFRRWATLHGGVYVPMDSATPPNPYLSHIAERDIETPSGRPLTLVNPAYMMRQTYSMMGLDSQASGHITSLKPLRPENAPDPWEREALEAFAKGKQVYETLIDAPTKHQYRYMKALSVEKGCLKCHASQGYQEGDVRGGIAVSIPLQREYALFTATVQGHLIRHIVALLVGWLLMGIAYFFVRRHFLARQNAETRLRSMVEEQESVIHAFSHDIRTPMVTLAGFSNELGQTLSALDAKENPILDPEERREIQEQIRFIQEAVGQLRSLQDGVLGYIRLWREALSMQQLDVSGIWQQILESRIMITRIKKAQIHTGPLPPCLADGKAMELILGQLLDNALKFTPEGEFPQIHFAGEIRGTSVVYTISDRGLGIPQEHRAQVFELFHRLNPTQGHTGSGLGLSVVKFLVQRMGGQVELDDGPGKKGLSVRIFLKK